MAHDDAAAWRLLTIDRFGMAGRHSRERSHLHGQDVTESSYYAGLWRPAGSIAL